MKEQSKAKKAESLLQLFDFPKEKKGFGAKEDILTLPGLALELGNATLKVNGGNEIHIHYFYNGLCEVRRMLIESSNIFDKQNRLIELSRLNNLREQMQKCAISYLECAFPASLIIAIGQNPNAFKPELIESFRNEIEDFKNGNYRDRLMCIHTYRALFLAIKSKKIVTTENLPSLNDAQLLLNNLREEYYLTLESSNSSN